MASEKILTAVNKAKNLLTSNDSITEQVTATQQINSFNGFLLNFSNVWTVLKAIVLIVEMLFEKEKIIGSDERIEVASVLLDDYLITFKGCLDFFQPYDDMVFKLLVSAAVNGLNDLFSHDWMEHATSKNDEDDGDEDELVSTILAMSQM